MTPSERAEALAQRALAKLDRTALARLVERYDDGARNGPSASKYLDAERWIRVCARRAVALDLDYCGPHADPPLSVLDIGTGAGYFPFICRELGHDATATDHPQRDPIYRALTSMLGLEVHGEVIEHGAPFAVVPTYDLITAFMVTFNRHREPEPWGVDEWSWFLEVAIGTLLPGGRLVLELNREPDGRCYTPELEALFRERGATFTARWPVTPRPGGHRLVFAR